MAAMTGKAIREALEPFAKAADGLDHYRDNLSLEVFAYTLRRLTVGDLRRARTAYDAIGSGVKGLKWVKHPTAEMWRAEAELGLYQVAAISQPSWSFDGVLLSTGINKSGGVTATADEAKAAAQADFERRVLSCLSTGKGYSISIGSGVKAEAPMAWITESDMERLAQSKKPLQLNVFPRDPSNISGTPYVALAASRPCPDCNGEGWTLTEGPDDRIVECPRCAARALSTHTAADARPSDDRLWDQTLTERDNYHAAADKLAEAIGELLGVNVGEHSSANSPWETALEHAWQAVRNRALSTHTSAGAGPVAGDFVLVPREPTEAMLKAAVETCGMPWLDAIPPHEDADDFILRQAFRAMLAAAPSTPSPQIDNAEAGPVKCPQCDFGIGGHEPGCVASECAGAGPVGEAVADARDEGWQPIETVPTGGKFGCFLMLAFGPPGDQTVSEGMHFQGRFYAASVFYTGGPHDTKQFTFREHEVKPTHWRHTLAAPGAARPVETRERLEKVEAAVHEAIKHLGDHDARAISRAIAMGLARNTLRAALTGDAQEVGTYVADAARYPG